MAFLAGWREVNAEHGRINGSFASVNTLDVILVHLLELFAGELVSMRNRVHIGSVACLVKGGSGFEVCPLSGARTFTGYTLLYLVGEYFSPLVVVLNGQCVRQPRLPMAHRSQLHGTQAGSVKTAPITKSVPMFV